MQQRASRRSADLPSFDHQDLGPTYMTPEEAAQALRISARTLANWRSQGTGPTYRKIGGRVVYLRASVMDFGKEIKGCQGSRPRMTVTVRPYPRDKARSQVDIMVHHPQTQAIVRRRLTSPKGMDSSAAKTWGEGQVRTIMRDLFQVKHDDADEKEEPKTKTKTSKAKEIPTCGSYWPTFETSYISTLKHSSQIGYRGQWGNHLRDIVQDIRLDQVDRVVFAQVKAACRAKGLIPSTVNQIVNKLRAMLRVAETDGVIASGITPKIQPEPEGRRKQKEVYSKEELGAVIKTAKGMGQEHHLLALLLVYLGMRIGEAAGLYWSDIDFTANEVEIQRNMIKGVQQDSPKGEIGTLSLHPELRAALLVWKKSTPHEGPRVFAWTDRQSQLRASTMEELSGLVAHGPHRIRHSVITHLVEDGKEPYEVQAFARHAKFQTTMSFYNHADRKKKAARAIESMSYGDQPQAEKKKPRTKVVGTGLPPRGTKPQIDRLSLN